MTRRNTLYFIAAAIIALSLICSMGTSSAEVTEIVNPATSDGVSVTVDRAGRGENILRADVRFCAEISNKECADSLSSFIIDDGKIFCHTTVYGADSYLEIKHIWYREGTHDQTVRLPVKSSRWRTWSVKTLFHGSEGKWRVEIFTGDMKIAEGTFTVAEKDGIARESQ